VRSDQDARLRDLLSADGVTVASTDGGALLVTGLSSAAVGRVAAQAGIALVELVPQQASLEEAFMEVTRSSLEFVGTGAA
jgi:ABC-2 type transport system ATP-binding protein